MLYLFHRLFGSLFSSKAILLYSLYSNPLKYLDLERSRNDSSNYWSIAAQLAELQKQKLLPDPKQLN